MKKKMINIVLLHFLLFFASSGTLFKYFTFLAPIVMGPSRVQAEVYQNALAADASHVIEEKYSSSHSGEKFTNVTEMQHLLSSTWLSIHPSISGTWIIHQGNYNESLDPLFDSVSSSSSPQFSDTNICAMITLNGSFSIQYEATINECNSSTGSSSSTRADRMTTDITVSPSLSQPSIYLQDHSCSPDSNGFVYFEIPFGLSHWLVVFLRKLPNSYQLMGFAVEYTTSAREFPHHWAGLHSSLMAIYAPDNMVLPLAMSYECKSTVTFDMDARDTVKMILHEMRFEAFTFSKKPVYSASIHCLSDSAFFSDLTTIAIFLGMACVFVSCCALACWTALKAHQASRKNTTSNLSPGNC